MSHPYRGGRSRRWLELKCVHEQELVIGGFTEPERERPRDKDPREVHRERS